VNSAEKAQDPARLLALAALRCTAGRLAAASTGIAGRLAAAVAGSTSWFRTTVASTTGRLAAAVAGIATGLAAAATSVMLLLAGKQALQATEQVVLLLAALRRTAARLAATSTGVAGRLAATVSGVASRFRTAIAGTTARLTAAIAGIAARLTARGTALVAEHLVKKLETKRLTTNGDAENQRTKEQHTLHRATSPLLVDHVRFIVPLTRFGHPEVVIYETVLRQTCRASP